MANPIAAMEARLRDVSDVRTAYLAGVEDGIRRCSWEHDGRRWVTHRCLPLTLVLRNLDRDFNQECPHKEYADKGLGMYCIRCGTRKEVEPTIDDQEATT